MPKRRKFAIIIALILSTVFLLSSCSSANEDSTEDLENVDAGGLVALSRQQGFIKGYGYTQYILYDPDTLVMYSMIWKGEGIAITPLYNADGTLKIYQEN